MSGSIRGRSSRHVPILNDAVKIKWPVTLMPKLLAGYPGYAIARIVDGNLEGLSLNTMGVQTQARDLGMLIDKYGNPTKSDQATLQNEHGARFQSVSAEWEIDDIVVSYESAHNRFDSGLLHIDTVKGLADSNAEIKRLTHGRTEL
jgi:hypothetical protein